MIMGISMDMSEPLNWWETFFSGLALESLRNMYPPEQTSADADFIQKALRLAPGSKVADVPCGNGRISIELAKRGYHVTGVDLTNELIDEAKRTAAAQGLTCTFEHRDMRDLPWPARFDGLFCFGNSFGYLGLAGNEEYLRAVHAALRPGGRFALETGLAAESLLANYPVAKRNWYVTGDTLMLREMSYDPARGEASTDYQFIRGAACEKKRAVYSIYMYREFEEMLKRAGFQEVQGYGSPSEAPYSLGDRVLYLTGTKPG
jgi:SAM-dependent methyltransferase